MALTPIPPPSAREAVLPPRAFECRVSAGTRAAQWVAVSGELDLAGAPELARALRRATAAARLVVLDLRHLDFIDATGIGVIVHADAAARPSGTRLVILRAPAHTDAAFTLTGADALVEIIDVPGHRSSEEAVLHVALELLDDRPAGGPEGFARPRGL